MLGLLDRLRSHSAFYIIVGAVVVRLFFLVLAIHNVGTQGFVNGDAIGYVDLARHIASGSGFGTSAADGAFRTEVFRTPGFPLLLSPFMRIPHGVAAYGVLMSVIVGVLLPLLTFLLARRLADERVATVAAALIAFEPHAVFYSFLLQTEISFMLFSFGALVLALRAYDRNMPLQAAVAGLLLAYAALIRPGYLPVFFVILIGTAITLLITKAPRAGLICVTFAMLVAGIAPWSMRNNALTGSYSISGAGWRNVYTDYLASVRSVRNDTPFYVEKRKLKDEAVSRFGFSSSDLNNPANASVLREASLSELRQDKLAVIKLETVVELSFFTNDGYYYDFRNLGLIGKSDAVTISPSHELLSKGVRALPEIFDQFARQLFVPLWGRAITVALLLCSVGGFILIRERIKYLFLAIILLAAVTASTIGFGVDARMRVPIEPLLYIFAAVCIVWLYDRIRSHYANRILHPGA